MARSAEAIRLRCASLVGFVREAWPVLEPRTTYVHNWHIDAICDHLEAVTDGRITRLLINVPPGSMKSLLVSVFWPAWEWAMGLRSMRYLTTSFAEDSVKRDTRKHRDLVVSDWYQALWPEVHLTRVGEMSFANAETGNREGVAFGSLTSKRGDRLIIDDPHSTKTAESEAERASTVRQFREGALNRLNDQAKSAIVVVMQRLHEQDVSGAILSLSMGYEHLMLPMEFEPGRNSSTSIGFRDPRTQDGELLDPVRFPPAVVEDLKIMGSYAYAGQYQQRPTAREGGLFKRHWFNGKVVPTDELPSGVRWVRYWDLAGTELKKGATRGARTAGVKMGRSPGGRYYVSHLAVAAKEGHAVRDLVHQTATEDGHAVEVHLSQDPGQAGKSQAQDYVALLAGFVARKHLEGGDKATRAEPYSAQCEAGNVYLVEGSWIGEYLDELCLFPGGARKDIADASSGAFGQLVPKPTTRTVPAGPMLVTGD